MQFWQIAQPLFENVTLVARRREHFRGFLTDFVVPELPQKRGCFNTQESHTHTPLSETLCFFKADCLHRHGPPE